MSEERVPFEELDEKDRARRKRSLRETRGAVTRLLDNEAGRARVRAIPDEEWEAAVEADQGEEEGETHAA